MSGVARSQTLLQATSAAAGNSNTWVSPTGYITLLKNVYGYNGGSTAATLQLVLHSPTRALYNNIPFGSLAASTTFSWQGWIALNPGDAFFFAFGGASMEVWAFGALLAGPNQFPPA